MVDAVSGVLANVLFPGGRAFLSSQAKAAFFEGIRQVEPLAHLLQVEERQGKAIELTPASMDAWQELLRLRSLQSGDNGVDLDSFLSDPRIESHAEHVFIRDVFYPCFGRQGLSKLRAQFKFERPDGRQARIDFAIPDAERPIAIEVNGKAYHSPADLTQDEYTEQTNRRNDLELAGWLVLEFTYHEISNSPETVITRLINAFAGRAGCPQPFPEESSSLSESQHFLLGAWSRVIPPIQRHLYGWLLNGLIGPQRALRLLLPKGLGGAALVALFDALEAAERTAELYGTTWPLPELDIVALEPNEEFAELARTTIRGFWAAEPDLEWERIEDASRLRTRWRCTLANTSDYTSQERFDLILVTALDGRPIDEQDLENWVSWLADDGQMGWLEPDAAANPTPSKSFDAPFPSAPTEETALYFLERFFGFKSFRDGQWGIVSRALGGLSTLGILPTGAGKTACFQLPAVLMPGITLVISPLVSLITDQVLNLRRVGLDFAGFVTGDQKDDEQKRELQRLRSGAYKLFYVSPERLQSKSFMALLNEALNKGDVRLSYFVIDEAHCMSDSGHDFRVSYLNLPEAFKELGPEKPVLALTATASRAIQEDVLSMLGLPNESCIRPDNFDRPELSFRVIPVRDEAEKQESLSRVLHKDLPQHFKVDSFDSLTYNGTRSEGAGLIFTPYRRQSENSKYFGTRPTLYARDLSAHLKQELGVPAEYYYSSEDDADEELHKEHKIQVQRRFKRDEIPVVVATKGFGTGIDKPNIRYVIHTTYTSALEGYYQEIGRAGRDRKEAQAIALYLPKHSSCRDEIPACASPNVFTCPYGLTSLCSYGIQAKFIQSSFPGVDAESRQHEAELRAVFGAVLPAGGEITIPKYQAVKNENPRDREVRYQRFLSMLEKLGFITKVSTTHPDTFFIDHKPLSREALLARANQLRGYQLVEDTEGLGWLKFCEKLAIHGLGLAQEEAYQLALFFHRYIFPKIGSPKKIPIDKRRDRYAPSRVETERLLYRLKKLGVISSYLDAQGRWVVQVKPFTRSQFDQNLEKALSKLRGAQTASALVARFKEIVSQNSSAADAVNTGLRLWLESYYEIYAQRKYTMLQSMEEYCAATDCRKSRMLNYLNSMGAAAQDQEKCGRCDVCGITSEVIQRPPTLDSLKRAEVEEAERRLADAFGKELSSLVVDELLGWFRSRKRLGLLRDRSRRYLEDWPEDLTTLCILALAYEALEERESSQRTFSDALTVAMLHENAIEVETVVRWMQPDQAIAVLEAGNPGIGSLLGDARQDALRYEAFLGLERQEEAAVILLEQLRSVTGAWSQDGVSLLLEERVK